MTPSAFERAAGMAHARKWKTSLRCMPEGAQRSVPIGTWLQRFECNVPQRNRIVRSPRREPRTEAIAEKLCEKDSNDTVAKAEELEDIMTTASETCLLLATNSDGTVHLPTKLKSSRNSKKRKVIHYTRMSSQEFAEHMGKVIKKQTPAAGELTDKQPTVETTNALYPTEL